MKRGSQIDYIPTHANGDILHQDRANYIQISPIFIINTGSGNVVGVKYFSTVRSLEIYTLDGKRFRLDGNEGLEAWKYFKSQSTPTMRFDQEV